MANSSDSEKMTQVLETVKKHGGVFNDEWEDKFGDNKESEIQKETVEKDSKPKDAEELGRLLRDLDAKKQKALEKTEKITVDEIDKVSEVDLLLELFLDYSNLSDSKAEFLDKSRRAKQEIVEALKKKKESLEKEMSKNADIGPKKEDSKDKFEEALKNLEDKKQRALAEVKKVSAEEVDEFKDREVFTDVALFDEHVELPDSDQIRSVAAEIVKAKQEIVEALEKRKEEAAKEKVDEAQAGEKEEVVPQEREGSKEIKPKNFEEKSEFDEEIERLEQELETARSQYAMADYKSTNLLSRLKSLLPIETKPENLEEVKDSLKNYKEIQNKLLEIKLEKIKSPGLEEKTEKEELGNLMKFFYQEEGIKLFEARTNSRAEINKDKFSEKAFQVINSTINWYRKLNWKQKLALGVVVGGAGLALSSWVTAGSIVSGVVSGAAGLKRLLGSASAGIGAAGMLESWHRRKEEKLFKEKKKEIFQKLEEDWDLDKLREFFVEDIEKTDKKLKREKREALRRRGVGVAVGVTVFFSSKAISYFFQSDEPTVEAKDPGTGVVEGVTQHQTEGAGVPKSSGIETGDKGVGSVETVPPKAESMGGSSEPETLPQSTPEPSHEATTQAEPEPRAGAMPEPEFRPEISSVTIEEGSNFEKTIINKLVEDGMDKGEAGKLAHEMAEKFAQENGLEKGAYSLVHPGDEIEIMKTPNGSYEIVEFRAESGIKPSWLGEGQESLGGEADQAIETETQIAETQGWIDSQESSFKELTEISQKISEIERGTNLIESQSELQEQLTKIDEAIERASTDEWNIDKDDSNLEKLTEQKMRIEKNLENLSTLDSLKEKYNITRINLLGNISRYLFSDAEGVSSFKDLSNINAEDYLDKNPSSKLAKFVKGLQGVLKNNGINPNQINPESSENISVWLAKKVLPQISKTRL